MFTNKNEKTASPDGCVQYATIALGLLILVSPRLSGVSCFLVAVRVTVTGAITTGSAIDEASVVLIAV